MSRQTLTAAQAIVKFLAAQRSAVDGREVAFFAGVWAIFGHGNVAGLGQALEPMQGTLPVWRGHNEQGMAHAAIAYAKAMQRRRAMVVTTSVGPGATNLVTAAAVAHVNRLPVLLLPGDVFASRRPDPVLQQLEVFGEPMASVNDCLRPVSRFFDRITRPEQLLVALPQAMRVLTDPADTGPVTLALPEDVQTEAWDFPRELFARGCGPLRRPRADVSELEAAALALAQAHKPLVVAGGGVHYASATSALADFAERHRVPVAETQAGKGALLWDHPSNVGGLGVTGSAAANQLAAEADLVLAVGTRLTDFTTASRSLFQNPACRIIALNIAAFDAAKHGALPLVGDARETLRALDARDWTAPAPWWERARTLVTQWYGAVEASTAVSERAPFSDAQVVAAVNRAAPADAIVVSAAGGLPGELHKLWRVRQVGGYHVEYGYSCMGYEIAAGLGVRLARPEHEVVVLVGDGSYLMMNSEIATATAMGLPLTIVVLDNRGFGSIHRLQRRVGAAAFNNLLTDVPRIDFVAHARALGAAAERLDSLEELERAMARRASGTRVFVIHTDPNVGTTVGGAWWDVPVAAVSEDEATRAARRAYDEKRRSLNGA